MLSSNARLIRLRGLRWAILALMSATGAWAQGQPSALPRSSPTEQQATPEQLAVPQTPTTKSIETTDKTGAGSAPIKLGPGDLVEVGVYGVPELTTKARVSNDGDLYLPLID